MTTFKTNAEEAAGLIAQSLTDNAAFMGRAPDRSDYMAGAVGLLAAAWMLARDSHENEAVARKDYAAILRSHLSAIEGEKV